MNICLIPARSGSKRLKNKNLLHLSGKTLLERTIQEAYSAYVFDAVILSTDIPMERINISNEQFDLIYDKRPAKLCRDSSKMNDVIAYIIDRFELDDDDILTLLQPTSPFRTALHIKKAIRLFKSRFKPVYSVKKVKGDSSWYCRMSGKTLKPVSTEKSAEHLYIFNGALYVFSVSQFRKRGSIPFSSFTPLIMNNKESIDIDEPEDYIYAKIIAESKKIKQEDK